MTNKRGSNTKKGKRGFQRVYPKLPIAPTPAVLTERVEQSKVSETAVHKIRPTQASLPNLTAEVSKDGFTTTEISVGVRFPEEDEQILFAKLLTTAGEKGVVPVIPEMAVAWLLERGFFSPEGAIIELKEGRANDCHSNSAKLWKLGEGNLMTGYALSSDGLWRQHSWVQSVNKIIETTTVRIRYYGFELTAEEAQQFYEANIY